MTRFWKSGGIAVLLAVLLVPAAFCASGPVNASLGKAIDALVARQKVTSETPGCAIAIIRDGKIIFEKGYGLANLDYSLPITPRTVFNIGSISKQFTASAIHLLAEEGRISLDDDIRKYLPEFPDYGRPITIRHLLHHISGIRDYEALMVPANMPYDRNYSPEELYAFITRQRELNFTPGAEFSYSNSGYVLLARIVRKVSGMSLGEFDKTRIFGPLGMNDTFFYEKMHVPVKNRAVGYDRSDGSYVTGLYDIYTVGASNLYTTVEDLARWDANFYKDKVGGPAFTGNLQTRGVLNSGENIGYASGLNIGEYRGLRTVWHNGWWAGFGSSMVRFPDQRFTVICLSNTTAFNPYDLPYAIADVFLSGVLKPVPSAASGKDESTVQKEISNTPPGNAAALATLAGEYSSDELGVTYTVSVDGGKLILKTPVTYDFVGYHFLAAENPLIQHTAASFGTSELTVDFKIENGKATGLVLGIPEVKLRIGFFRK